MTEKEIKKEEWVRKKYSSLQGNTEVSFAHPRGLIKVQALGVLVQEVYLDSYDEMQDFAKALSDAWVEKEKLHKALRETIMGPQKQ